MPDCDGSSGVILEADYTFFLAPEEQCSAVWPVPLSTTVTMRRRQSVLLERVGPNRHPCLSVALALSLVTETGGPADYQGGHVILGDVLKARYG